jgi:hypothetical protein
MARGGYFTQVSGTTVRELFDFTDLHVVFRLRHPFGRLGFLHRNFNAGDLDLLTNMRR